MQRPKAHHFVPVAHLARFSGDPDSIPPRDRRLNVFDKRSGSYRTSRAGKAAFENDLYTTRLPDLSALEPDPVQLVRAVLDPANKDSELESDKAEIEERGIAAIREIESWPSGPRGLTEDERVPFLSYVGLLLAQHPTMMEARQALISGRFWAVAERRVTRDPILERIVAEMDHGAGALAVVFDGLALALELNYLAWKVVRWTNPRLILGDVVAAAWYPGAPLGVGHPWQPDSKLAIPISPTSAVILGGVGPGICRVEERGESISEVDALNVISWARSRSEVYAMTREDLERVASQLGPLDPTASYSRQLAVRESVLPEFAVDVRGDLRISQPDPPDPDATRRRFEARF